MSGSSGAAKKLLLLLVVVLLLNFPILTLTEFILEARIPTVSFAGGRSLQSWVVVRGGKYKCRN